MNFHRGLPGALPPPPTRSKAPGTRTAKARASGTASPTRRATSMRETGDVACDHYHRWREDVDLMQAPGLKAYRFSIAWPRVLPQGTGAINPPGWISTTASWTPCSQPASSPIATLYHWDLPQALQDQGGWLEPRLPAWFADYADQVFRRLGDRVTNWSTINEPWVAGFVGHAFGTHPPGLANLSDAYQAIHHLLLAHGKAVQAIPGWGLPRQDRHRAQPRPLPTRQLLHRRHGRLPARLLTNPRRSSPGPSSKAATLLLILNGSVPTSPRVAAGDLQTISEPCDYLGVNYYMTMSVAHSPTGGYLKTAIKQVSALGWGHTDVGWGVNPAGLTAVLLDLSRTYGAAEYHGDRERRCLPRPARRGGFVADAARVRYLREHLLAIHDAIQAGAPVTGYYVWSLMDNFEWSQGYRPRFGLVRVDYATQQRIPKQSAGWYAGVIARNGLDE